jgi:hypothetical protein
VIGVVFGYVFGITSVGAGAFFGIALSRCSRCSLATVLAFSGLKLFGLF